MASFNLLKIYSLFLEISGNSRREFWGSTIPGNSWEFRRGISGGLDLRGLTSKSDTIHTNIQINGPKLDKTYEYVWAVTNTAIENNVNELMRLVITYGRYNIDNVASSYRH